MKRHAHGSARRRWRRPLVRRREIDYIMDGGPSTMETMHEGDDARNKAAALLRGTNPSSYGSQLWSPLFTQVRQNSMRLVVAIIFSRARLLMVISLLELFPVVPPFTFLRGLQHCSPFPFSSPKGPSPCPGFLRVSCLAWCLGAYLTT